MKYVYSLFIAMLLTLTSCNSTRQQSPVSNNSMAFYSHLSIKDETHKLYEPGDPDIPHPFSFYDDMANDPVYPYNNACGYGSFLFDPDLNELYYAVSYSSLSGDPIMMHFHLGGPTVGGPIIQTIFGEPYTNVKGLGSSTEPPLFGKRGPSSRAGFVTGVYKLQGNPFLTPPLSVEEEKEKLLNGEIYVNIHTYLNEAGEIRGQILPCTE